MDPRLEQVFSLLPHRCDSIFIAGGAAVDYDKAGNVDLIFGGKNGFKNAQQFLKSFAFYSLYTGEAYSTGDLHLIGDAYHDIDGKIIQVLWTKDKTAAEIISKFDISTHAAAWTSKGDYVVSEDAGEVKIRSAYTNHKTFGRYIKICNRYECPVDISILEQLSSLKVGKIVPKITAIDELLYGSSKSGKSISWSWDSETNLTSDLKSYWEKSAKLHPNWPKSSDKT